MAKIDINGDIIRNDDKWLYDWFEYESTCPSDIKTVMESCPDGEGIEVFINSGGGNVFAGQEIYSLLKQRKDVTITIQSLAGSAASVIAMAGYTRISPVAMLMIHNASISGVSGDYHEMDKRSEMLKQVNSALAAAYEAKTKKTQNEVLELMDNETWLDAKRAIEFGFVDEIIQDELELTNGFGVMKVTEQMRQQATREKAEVEAKAKLKKDIKNQLLQDLDFFGV